MKKYCFIFDGKQWYLEISTLQTLNDYMDMVWNIRKEDLLYDLKRLIEDKGAHPTSDIISVCHTLSKAKGTDLWTEFQHLKEKQHRAMSGMVLHDITLYVNPAGGYTASLEKLEARYPSDNMRWPVLSENDIRIRKWPEGTHYYAYIGPVQVKDGGRLKWESESDARFAAMRYVTKKSKLK